MMKKIVLSAIVVLLATAQAKAQENFEQIQNETEITQTAANEAVGEITDKIGEAMTVATDAMSAGIGEFMDGFVNSMAKMITVIEVCKEEDKNSVPMTQETAENIIKTISPDNISAFVINIDEQTGEFAKANFRSGESQISMQLAKSYCWVMTEDMIKDIDNSMNKVADNTKKAMEKSIDDSSLSEAQITEQSNPSVKKEKVTIMIADDEVEMDKFQPNNINDFEGMKAIEDEKQSAYVFGFIGSLSIGIKAAGGNYNEEIDNIIRGIDIRSLQEIIGKESIGEIKARLNPRIEEKIRNIEQQMPEKL